MTRPPTPRRSSQACPTGSPATSSSTIRICRPGVNALWDGGASGIQAMDQRLISAAAVRCVGLIL
jgi:uncharacterized protein YlxW (UPF0749 family)